MDNVKLKPCPFCGRKRIQSDWFPVEIPGCDIWRVECVCGGQVLDDTKAKAEKIWNSRTQ